MSEDMLLWIVTALACPIALLLPRNEEDFDAGCE